jgi:hypothetical protein
MKLIKNKNRILTEDGNKTYRAFGIFFSVNNKFFVGNVIIRFKFGFRDRSVKDGILKTESTHKKIKGFFYKYLEILFIKIPKGK